MKKFTLKVAMVGMSLIATTLWAEETVAEVVATDVAAVPDTSVVTDTASVTVDQAAVQVSTDATAEGLPANVIQTPSMASSASEQASEALKAKEGDANKQQAIEEVFTRNKTYSMAKKGSYSANFDTDYSFYRSTRIDTEIENRFNVDNDAQHGITNVFSVQYGLRDNLSLGVSLPIVAKTDVRVAESVVGVGDVGLSLRWEPFELERKRMPISVGANISTATGQSALNIDPNETLSTGKGFYSFGGSLSTRKYLDPVVLFASTSLGYGLKVTGLNQNRGGRVLEAFQPGLNLGFSMGYAYSLNYDVSITMSYSQGFSVRNGYEYKTGERITSGLNSSGSLTTSLGLRVSPKTLVNASLALGVTEDAPDISLGFSLPLDFLGFGKQLK